MAFKASPSSQHQHCTDEAQKAETVLSAVSYIYVCVCVCVCVCVYVYVYVFIILYGDASFCRSAQSKMENLLKK